MSDLAGQTIKGYELRERIGAGGFGAVYRAYQSTVGREVAIKIILPGFTNHPDFVRRGYSIWSMVARTGRLSVPLRMRPMPLPGAANDLLQFGILGLPAKLGAQFVGAGDQAWGVSRASGGLDRPQLVPRYRPGGLNHLPH